MTQGPQKVSAAEFKANCLRLMDEVQRSRKPIIITKHGKPVAKLVPYDEQVPQIYGFLSGSVKIHGDIVGPLDEAWEANEQ